MLHAPRTRDAVVPKAAILHITASRALLPVATASEYRAVGVKCRAAGVPKVMPRWAHGDVFCRTGRCRGSLGGEQPSLAIACCAAIVILRDAGAKLHVVPQRTTHHDMLGLTHILPVGARFKRPRRTFDAHVVILRD